VSASKKTLSHPKHLTILGVKYALKVVPGLSDSGANGICNQRTKQIFIDASISGDDFWWTLVHEVGHAIEAEGSINQALPPEVFEIITDLFGKVISQNFDVTYKKVGKK